MSDMIQDECHNIQIQVDDSYTDQDATQYNGLYACSPSPYSSTHDLSPFHSPFTPPRPISRRSSASSFQQPQFRDTSSSNQEFYGSPVHSYSPLHIDTTMALASPFSCSSALGGSALSHDDMYLSPYSNPNSALSASSASLESLLLTPDDVNSGRGRSLCRNQNQGFLSPIDSRSRASSVASITRLDHPFPAPEGTYTLDDFENFGSAMLLESSSETLKPLDPGGCLDPRIELGGSDSDLSPILERAEMKPVASDAVKTASANRRKHAAHHKCDKCGQTFTAKHNLINHQNSHEGIRPFRCEYCPQLFGTSGVLARHVKKRHGDIDESDGEGDSPRRTRVRARRIGRRYTAAS